MKDLKSGQLCTINGQLYRAKTRTNGCNGCAFNTIPGCPNIVFQNVQKQEDEIACKINQIILVKISEEEA